MPGAGAIYDHHKRNEAKKKMPIVRNIDSQFMGIAKRRDWLIPLNLSDGLDPRVARLISVGTSITVPLSR